MVRSRRKTAGPPWPGKRGSHIMGYDVAFTKRCFPARVGLIDNLAARNESFRDLCYDFATAEEVRLAWETASGPEKDERHAESVELVDCLRSEIEAALDDAAVVPFQRRRT
ncbi:hypothetical protein BMJ34_25760 [Sinorhizobium medicae]|nr:hypothetical protein BMJ34_25760 [Sinorhizobium medicae]PLU18613.1 hypothetical protein BMJ30_12745 [Sinorhizobium medicae]PLU34629.1 hypothetical protein BMJ27_14460 [Sinorhizobium medicae]